MTHAAPRASQPAPSIGAGQCCLDHGTDLVGALDETGDGFWTLELPGRGFLPSRRFLDAFGYGPGVLPAGPEALDVLVHPDDLAIVQPVVDDVLRGARDAWLLEHRLVRRDGSPAWVMSRGRALSRDDEGHATKIVGIVTDLSEPYAAEASLRESRESLARLTNTMHDGWLLFGSDGRITAANPRACELLGISTEQVIGLSPATRPWVALDASGSPADPQEAASARVLATGEAVTNRILGLQRPDGATVWVSQNAVPARRDPAGRVTEVIVTLSDVTELRQARENAERDRARLEQVLDAAVDAVWVLDDGVIEWANPAMARVFGRPPEGLAGLHMLELLEPDDRADAAEKIRQAIDGTDIFVERRIRRPDGQTRWIEIRGHPLGGSRTEAVARDITERKVLEAERDQLLAAVEGSSAAVVLADAGGSIRYLNQAAQQMTGFVRAEIVGATLDFSSVVAPATAVAELTAALARGDTWAGDLAVRRRDGSQLTSAVHASPIRDADGKTRFMVTSLDVTRERLLEERLADAARLESVGRLAGGVAHDFNNILTAILGHAELAADSIAPESAAAADVQSIVKAAGRAQALTRQLLAFSRRSMLRPEPVLLGDAAEALQPMLERLIGEDVELALDRAPEVGPVRVDPAMLDHAITNLVVNARDAMPGGGTVRIATGPAPQSVARPGQWSFLRVQDEGTGIDPEVLARVFEPFFTTKAPGQGSGLGLSMVQGFVAQSEGSVDIESAPGLGTVVSIYLPVGPSGAAVEDDAPTPGAEAFPAPRGVLLVVEDEPMLRSVARRMLEGAGYEVLVAQNAAEALDVLTRSRADLLFTDIVVPGMSGLELARVARELHPSLRVLVSSGYTDEEIGRRGLELDGRAFLAKPYDRTALLAAVAATLASPVANPATQTAPMTSHGGS